LALRKNRTLDTLNLDFNEFTDESLLGLEAALVANERSAIINIGLGEHSDSRKFTTKGAHAVWKLMNKKPELIVVGDPPFTIDVDDMTTLLNSSAPPPSSTPSSPLGFLASPSFATLSAAANPLLSTLSAVTGNTDYFEKVALESHTRMRKGDLAVKESTN